MLDGGFKETREGVAELPVDDPNAFALFVQWVYGGTTPLLYNPKLQTLLATPGMTFCKAAGELNR